MAKQRKITKASEFSAGIIANFFGIAALIVATVLFLFKTVDVTTNINSSESNFAMSIEDLSLLFFFTGLSCICVGSYMKKQQGLVHWQFLMAIISIIIGLVIFLIFDVIVKNIGINTWTSESMCMYFSYAAQFIIYAGCFLLVRGNIKGANTFHAEKCLKINNLAGILICLMLVFHYVSQIGMDVSTGLLPEWVLIMYLLASVSGCFAAIISVYILLITTRGFARDWTKMVKVITLITVITCALCLQLSNVSAIILTHLININSDALANFLTNTAPALEKAAYWCQSAYLACFIPFAFFIMNWKNLLPTRVAY